MKDNLISPLGRGSINIETIRTSFKQYLQEKNIIKDVNYLGSNISQLIDIIAYAIYNINATNALLSNETMLPTATIRQNIIEIAKTLGYHITRRISSRINVTISKGCLEEGRSVLVPKYTKFTSENYTFLLEEDLLITYNNKYITIDLKEGKLIDSNVDETLHKVITKPTNEIMLNYKFIEENSIKVYLKKANTSTFVRLERVKSLLDFNDLDVNYFEDYNSDTGWVKLITSYIGNGYILQPDDEIKVEFLVSSGIEANNVSDLVIHGDEIFYDDLGNEIELDLTINSISRAGAEEESNDSIKEYAPLFYNTGNRLVTEIDYESFLTREANVEVACAWGGEKMPEHQRGRIYISCISQDYFLKFFSNRTIAGFLDLLYKNRIVSTERVYWHPIYIYLDLDINILGTVKDLSDKQSEINQRLLNIYNKNYKRFKSYVYYSKIVRSLESVFDDDYKASVEIELKPRLRIDIHNFDNLYTNANGEDYLMISIPKSPKQYMLVKGTDKILLKDDGYINGKDINSYILNGWQLVYSDAASPLNVTFHHDDLVVEDNVLYYKSKNIGYFDEEESILWIKPELKDQLEVDVLNYIDIRLEHDRFVNIKLERNSFLTLGEIRYF